MKHIIEISIKKCVYPVHNIRRTKIETLMETRTEHAAMKNAPRVVGGVRQGVRYLLGDKNSRFLKSMLNIFKLALFRVPSGAIEVDANFPDMKQ